MIGLSITVEDSLDILDKLLSNSDEAKDQVSGDLYKDIIRHAKSEQTTSNLLSATNLY